VDLVGPGPAYERWKKTPEYQQWLKDTKQTIVEAPKPESKAFVVMGRGLVGERKFDTLTEAVSRASDGDTIELRGNGPFFTQPINIPRTALTIRAGEGCRPVIKLAPEAVESELHLLSSNGPLVLEGLELHRAPSKDQTSRSAVQMYEAPFWAANCRFRAAVYADYSDVCALRNCEMVHTGNGGVGGRRRPGARDTFDNCLFATKGTAIGFQIDDAALHNVSIQISRSTLLNSFAPLWLIFQGPTFGSRQPSASEALRLDVSGSIFDAWHVIGFERHDDARDKAAGFDPLEEANTLTRLVHWHGKGNLFPSGHTSVVWWADGKKQTPHGPKSLKDWRQFWGSAEIDSLEGNARFQGGNLVSRLDGDLDQLTPDDFRLRPDSAGYRAGPDGKDLGADVDFVGPGLAYERWKKTPEYQQWLKETGEMK